MEEKPETSAPASGDFSRRVLGFLNEGMLGMMASIGHRTGLFDVMAGLPPSTSRQIADAAGLQERYVREWLAALAMGRVVDYDPEARTYRLPPEHAASLTRAAGPDNLATLMQYIGLLGAVEDEVVECFRHGGGVPYSSFPGFQRLQSEESRLHYDHTLLEVTLPLVPGLVERLRQGSEVLDVGCGHGHTLNLLAREFPASRFTGRDLSEKGIAAGRAEAAELGLANIRFEVADVTRLAEEGRFDLVTAFDVIHDLAHPRRTLEAIARALRPDGLFLMVEIAASSELQDNGDHPLAPTLYAVSLMHCMTVSLAQGGEGLGAVWGEQGARRMLADVGFDSVEVHRVPGDRINNYYVARRSA